MTIYEFNPGGEPQLPLDDKAHFTWDNCVFLMAYAEDAHHAANLYYAKFSRYREEFFIERGSPRSGTRRFGIMWRQQNRFHRLLPDYQASEHLPGLSKAGRTMSKISDYIERVSADSAAELMRKINQMVEEGWRLAGQPGVNKYIDPKTGEERTKHLQLVYRYKRDGDISLPE